MNKVLIFLSIFGIVSLSATQQYQKSCEDILEYNAVAKDGIYYIDPNMDGKPVEVYCDMKNSGYIEFKLKEYKHKDGSSDIAWASKTGHVYNKNEIIELGGLISEGIVPKYKMVHTIRKADVIKGTFNNSITFMAKSLENDEFYHIHFINGLFTRIEMSGDTDLPSLWLFK
jgi:hypothetical protein